MKRLGTKKLSSLVVINATQLSYMCSITANCMALTLRTRSQWKTHRVNISTFILREVESFSVGFHFFLWGHRATVLYVRHTICLRQSKRCPLRWRSKAVQRHVQIKYCTVGDSICTKCLWKYLCFAQFLKTAWMYPSCCHQHPTFYQIMVSHVSIPTITFIKSAIWFINLAMLLDTKFLDKPWCVLGQL